ncbi:MAG: helix-turn-helix domain-containing protein, partial [Actinomycetota bacterium]|nr:helix-turn-helix domain-containing protein [Actinomycetota bacterium]
VRNWLRRFASAAEAVRVFFTAVAHRLDPMLAPLAPAAGAVADAVEAVAVAARAAVQRFGPRHPWHFASAVSGGALLSNTGCLYPGAV